MIKKLLTAFTAGLAVAGSTALAPAYATGGGEFIQNVEHGQCLTVEGSGFVNTIIDTDQPYGVTTRPCTDTHKPWQTWTVDAEAHRIHPAAYPEKCLQTVLDAPKAHPENTGLYLQTLPCDPDNTAQDFTFQNTQFRGEFTLVSDHPFKDHGRETFVSAFRKEDSGSSIGLSYADDTPVPNNRWKRTPA